MRHVATRAGVSTQTVSNFLRGRLEQMAEPTARRVEQAVLELGYVPDRLAGSLRSTRSYSLGFVLVDEGMRYLADPMTDLIIAGIGDVARERGYSILIHAARPGSPSRALITPLLEHRVDGAFLFFSGSPAIRHSYMEAMETLTIPLALFEDLSADRSVISVTAANRQGAKAVTEHLIRRGHRRIAFLAACVPWPAVEQRHLGYRDALRANGIPTQPDCEVFEGGWDASNGCELATKLLAMPEPPTAIVAGNDLLALGVLRAAKGLSLRVPDDVAVVGFDDFEFAAFSDPPLTTVRIPGYEMGLTAASLLLEAVQGKATSRRRVVLQVEVVQRGSA